MTSSTEHAQRTQRDFRGSDHPHPVVLPNNGTSSHRRSGSLHVNQSFSSSQSQFRGTRVKKKSKCVTYLLALFLGVFGGHHFYLGRRTFGTVYIFTGGLLGMGYIVDLIRVPWLVENANYELTHPEMRGRKYMADAFLLWLPPFGILGCHHFYLGNTYTGVVYIISIGACIIGWLLDLCFIPFIWMKLANTNYEYGNVTLNATSSTDHPYNITDGVVTPDYSVVTSHNPAETEIDDDLFITAEISPPPPYTEVDELAPANTDADPPPSYTDVLAMGAMTR